MHIFQVQWEKVPNSYTYVDDILLVSSVRSLLHETKKFLSSYFKLKDLRDASFVLGIHIKRDHLRGILRLSQKAYIEKVLKRYGMQKCSPRDTLMAKGDKFILQQCPKVELQIKEMRKSLMPLL